MPLTARIFASTSGGDLPELAEADLVAMGRMLIHINGENVYGKSYLPEPSE